MRITVANVKGGVGKTTTAVHLAAGLSRHGRTLLVDADPKASAYAWSTVEGADLPFPVIPWSGRDLTRRLTQVAGDYTHIVVDTGPEQEHLVRAALMASDQLLIPLGPTTMEVHRLGATFTVAAEAEDLGATFTTHVLLTRTTTGYRSTREARNLLHARHVPVLAASIRRLEALAQTYGQPLTDLSDYEHALDELLTARGGEA